MRPEDLPGRGGRGAARITNRTTLLAIQDTTIADTDCTVDPADLSPDDAIRTLSVHHHCPSPCIGPRTSGSAPDADPKTSGPDKVRSQDCRRTDAASAVQ
ncbi:hypothetical protein [Nocardia gipuzkoensis]